MRLLLLAVTLIASLTTLVSAAGQSLAEVSRNTEAARNGTAGRPPAKVYTNKDLSAVDTLPPAPAPTKPAASAAAPSSAAPSAGALAPVVKDEAYWRDRMRPLRERLDTALARADDTKRRADALMRSADRCFMVGVVCADYTESLRLTVEHQTLIADVASAEREVAALEDEARRAGVPAGWLRK